MRCLALSLFARLARHGLAHREGAAAARRGMQDPALIEGALALYAALLGAGAGAGAARVHAEAEVAAGQAMAQGLACSALCTALVMAGRHACVPTALEAARAAMSTPGARRLGAMVMLEAIVRQGPRTALGAVRELGAGCAAVSRRQPALKLTWHVPHEKGQRSSM